MTYYFLLVQFTILCVFLAYFDQKRVHLEAKICSFLIFKEKAKLISKTKVPEACKGQLISKAIYGLLTSPKKLTDEFVLFAFLLFMANKSNLSVRFLGESTACQSAFRFYLTFGVYTKKLNRYKSDLNIKF